MKALIHTIIVLVVGTLVGTAITKVSSIIWTQQSRIMSVLDTAINTGLNPTTIDLGVIQFTLGLIFKLNIATVVGILITAIVYKQIIK